LEYCETLSHNAVKEILKKRVKATSEKDMVHRRDQCRLLAQMVRLLWLYSLPLDARFPVGCFDERPCFLISHTLSALALKAGSISKEHYECESRVEG
jgi:hypothetical protein